MKILIGQPKLEASIEQLEAELRSHPEADIVLYPEGYLNDHVDQACRLASAFGTSIISGYKKPKDRAIIMNRKGEILLDRAKYEAGAVTELDGLGIACLLCDELVLQGLPADESVRRDLIVHPIGVGMFSQAQFDEWVETARQIARANRAMIIGTSHADGSFRDSEVSLPIAYCIDSSGEDVFISNSDVRSRILNFNTHDVIIIPNSGEVTVGG
ncbi:hypothetical protein PDENDC454_06235 [Paenibacillus dendritiformis C454]|uniref:CN hydrolase domain-containing protein n=1 Tax=Paenibacillus dendritiformis C454 TaxID=1131935 RepID=H3SCK8_9BACL|nr:hypothetical protein [Paenibacillus dendritiformis]EHQ63111.1 hypothetical protein PDENDC454_06235 [Paenibacillus dendritiformis C454]